MLIHQRKKNSSAHQFENVQLRISSWIFMFGHFSSQSKPEKEMIQSTEWDYFRTPQFSLLTTSSADVATEPR